MMRFSSFVIRTLIERLRLRMHRLLRIERTIRVGGRSLKLPPGHRLPMYQAITPTYDRYAAPLLASLCRGASLPVLVDIGANVGDTAALALEAVPNIRVIAVEGDKTFVSYLRRNMAGQESRVEIVPKFVESPLHHELEFRTDGSTGRFVAAAQGGERYDSIAIDALISRAGPADLILLKSDTDGLDIDLLLSGWDAINGVCGVIWFEFDVTLDIASGAHVPELAARIAASKRTCRVIDNLGRHMFDVGPADVVSILTGLSRWFMAHRRPGDIAYIDIWAVTPELVEKLP